MYRYPHLGQATMAKLREEAAIKLQKIVRSHLVRAQMRDVAKEYVKLKTLRGKEVAKEMVEEVDADIIAQQAAIAWAWDNDKVRVCMCVCVCVRVCWETACQG